MRRSSLAARPVHGVGLLLALLLATCLVAASPGLTAGGDPARICGAAKSGEQCGPGNGRRTARIAPNPGLRASAARSMSRSISTS